MGCTSRFVPDLISGHSRSPEVNGYPSMVPVTLD